MHNDRLINVSILFSRHDKSIFMLFVKLFHHIACTFYNLDPGPFLKGSVNIRKDEYSFNAYDDFNLPVISYRGRKYELHFIANQHHDVARNKNIFYPIDVSKPLDETILHDLRNITLTGKLPPPNLNQRIPLVMQGSDFYDKDCFDLVESLHDENIKIIISKYSNPPSYYIGLKNGKWVFKKKLDIDNEMDAFFSSHFQKTKISHDTLKIHSIISGQDFPEILQRKIFPYQIQYNTEPDRRIMFVGVSDIKPAASAAIDMCSIVEHRLDNFQCAWLTEIPLIPKTPRNWNWKELEDNYLSQFVEMNQASGKLYFYLPDNTDHIAFKWLTYGKVKTAQLSNRDLLSFGFTQEDIDQLHEIILSHTQENEELLKTKFFQKIIALATQKQLTRISGATYTVLSEGVLENKTADIDRLIILKEMVVNPIQIAGASASPAVSVTQEEKEEQEKIILSVPFMPPISENDKTSGKNLAIRFKDRPWPDRICILCDQYTEGHKAGKEIVYDAVVKKLLNSINSAPESSNEQEHFHQAVCEAIKESIEIRNKKLIVKVLSKKTWTGSSWPQFLVAMSTWLNEEIDAKNMIRKQERQLQEQKEETIHADYLQKIIDLNQLYHLGATANLASSTELYDYTTHLISMYVEELSFHETDLPKIFVETINVLQEVSQQHSGINLHTEYCRIIADLYQKTLFTETLSHEKWHTYDWIWKYIEALADILEADHLYRLQNKMAEKNKQDAHVFPPMESEEKKIEAKQDRQPEQPAAESEFGSHGEEENAIHEQSEQKVTDLPDAEEAESVKPPPTYEEYIATYRPPTDRPPTEEDEHDKLLDELTDDVHQGSLAAASSSEDKIGSRIPSGKTFQTLFSDKPKAYDPDAPESKSGGYERTFTSQDIRSRLITDRDAMMQRSIDIPQLIIRLTQQTVTMPARIEKYHQHISFIQEQMAQEEDMSKKDRFAGMLKSLREDCDDLMQRHKEITDRITSVEQEEKNIPASIQKINAEIRLFDTIQTLIQTLVQESHANRDSAPKSPGQG